MINNNQFLITVFERLALAIASNDLQNRTSFDTSVFSVRGLVWVDNSTSAEDFSSIVRDDDDNCDDRLDFDAL